MIHIPIRRGVTTLGKLYNITNNNAASIKTLIDARYARVSAPDIFRFNQNLTVSLHYSGCKQFISDNFHVGSTFMFSYIREEMEESDYITLYFEIIAYADLFNMVLVSNTGFPVETCCNFKGNFTIDQKFRLPVREEQKVAFLNLLEVKPENKNLIIKSLSQHPYTFDNLINCITAINRRLTFNELIKF